MKYCVGLYGVIFFLHLHIRSRVTEKNVKLAVKNDSSQSHNPCCTCGGSGHHPMTDHITPAAHVVNMDTMTDHILTPAAHAVEIATYLRMELVSTPA